MQTANVLFSSRAEDIEFFINAAHGNQVILAKDPTSLEPLLKSGKNLTIILDASDRQNFKAQELAIQKYISQYPKLLSQNRFFYIITDEVSDNLTKLDFMPFGSNFVVRRFGLQPSESAKKYQPAFAASNSSNSFGLKTILGKDSSTFSYTLMNSSEKNNLIAEVGKKIMDLNCPSRIAELISLGLDELIMNAVFNAPIDANGKHIHVNTPRDSDIELNGRNSIYINLGYNSSFIGISVADMYGSLKKDFIYKHLLRSLSGVSESISSLGGMGVGLSILYKSGASIYAVCNPEVKTEITVLFRRVNSYKELRNEFQFITMQIYE